MHSARPSVHNFGVVSEAAVRRVCVRRGLTARRKKPRQDCRTLPILRPSDALAAAGAAQLNYAHGAGGCSRLEDAVLAPLLSKEQLAGLGALLEGEAAACESGRLRQLRTSILARVVPAMRRSVLSSMEKLGQDGAARRRCPCPAPQAAFLASLEPLRRGVLWRAILPPTQDLVQVAANTMLPSLAWGTHTQIASCRGEGGGGMDVSVKHCLVSDLDAQTTSSTAAARRSRCGSTRAWSSCSPARSEASRRTWTPPPCPVVPSLPLAAALLLLVHSCVASVSLLGKWARSFFSG